MTASEVRKKFSDFFNSKGHTKLPAASLIPHNDPSVLFTTAGMQQFKPFYAEPEHSPHRRIATIQPCFRTSDIDEVGDDTHLTFFEMLGNFSFGYNPEESSPNGAYFKQEAIKWAWEFMTDKDGLGINPERITVSIFKGEKNIPLDETSREIWQEIGLSDKQITLGSREDNFWGPTGSEGPCGPNTELYVDGIEVWNLVFNEYYQDRDGNLIPLDLQGVDTGMGLERLLAVINNQKTIFETDVHAPLISVLSFVAEEPKKRVISDHCKGILFLVNEGLEPSNLGREYILRRLLRRLLITEEIRTSLPQLLKTVFDLYKTEYGLPHSLVEKCETVVAREWEQFSRTLEKGKVYISKIKNKSVSGKDAFQIYSTYGIPIDAQKDLFGGQVKIDQEGFEREFLASLEAHRTVSRAGATQKFGGHGLVSKEGEIPADLNPTEYKKALSNHTATHLLHAALRAVLGSHVEQKGSDVAPDRLRFDFTHSNPLTPQEKEQVEEWVNRQIEKQLPVTIKEMNKQEALDSGALAFFPERYPETCKVYIIGDPAHPISMELCGGPHVTNTGEIGHFKITSEKSSSAGIRRIKATTSLTA